MSAFSVGSIFYKYGLLIEGSSSVEFLQKKVTPVMFSNYFCRMFKKVTSITPSQYLKNVRMEGRLI